MRVAVLAGNWVSSVSQAFSAPTARDRGEAGGDAAATTTAVRRMEGRAPARR